MLYKCEFTNGEDRALEVACFADLCADVLWLLMFLDCLVADVFGLPDHLTEFPVTLQGSCSSTSTWAGLQGQGKDKDKDLVLFLWRQLVVNFLRQLLSAVVGEVGPDELLLGEAEDTEPAAFQGVVDHVARVGHYFLSLEDPAGRILFTSASLDPPESDQPDLGAVDEQPTVSHLKMVLVYKQQARPKFWNY